MIKNLLQIDRSSCGQSPKVGVMCLLDLWTNQTEVNMKKAWIRDSSQKRRLRLKFERSKTQETRCGGRRSCRPKHLFQAGSFAFFFFLLRKEMQLPAPAREMEKTQKQIQCGVLLHHCIGLENYGPTSDAGSQTLLGCIPFSRAQLSSMDPCNYL